jgi:integrase
MDVGLDSATRRRRQYWHSGFPTRKAAEEALRKALGRLDAGQDPFPEKITLVEFVDRLLDHWRTQGKPRPRTRHEYERLLRRRVLPVIGGHEMAKVRPAHCQTVIDAAVRDGVAPGQLRAVMSSAFETALRWGLVPVNPVRATTALSRSRPKLTVPDARQMRTLIEAAVGTPWEVPTLLAATTGARRAEVLGLRWRDVDLDRGRVRIDKTLQRIDGELRFVPPKTERARRELPLPGFAAERLRAYKADQARRRLSLGAGWVDLDLVCERGDGGPLEPDSFSKGVARIAGAVGLEGVRLHDLRHAVATTLAKRGVPAYVTSKVLGHSSVHFTTNTYQHADEETVDRALAGLDEAFGS